MANTRMSERDRIALGEGDTKETELLDSREEILDMRRFATAPSHSQEEQGQRDPWD